LVFAIFMFSGALLWKPFYKTLDSMVWGYIHIGIAGVAFVAGMLMVFFIVDMDDK